MQNAKHVVSLYGHILSLLCAFFMLKILIAWQIWLLVTADKTKRRYWRQNVTFWLNVQWFRLASVEQRIGFQKKTIVWDCRPVILKLNYSYRNVAQRDYEIMMTLDLDLWLMLCSREEFSFRNVHVSMLVGTKRLYTHKWFKNTD